MTNTKSTVLYVDDEQSNLRIFKSTFRWDFNVLTALSGEEGLKLLEENACQLVISDQRMPNQTGVEFLKKVKERFPTTIRIILTGFSDVEAIVEAINQVGIYRYMTKPWDADEMRLAIDKALEIWNLQTENTRLINNLREVNETLEKKVDERTAELTRKNQELGQKTIEVEQQRRNIEEQNNVLEEANQNLTRLNNEKNQLIGIVAHDLRSPLSNIKGLATFVEKTADNLTDEQKKLISLIKKSSERLNEMVVRILDINAIESKKINLELQNTLISPLIKDLKPAFAEQLKQKDIELKIDIEDQTLTAQTDTNYLIQILENLLGNAIKFSPKNRVITIGLKNYAENEVAIWVSDQGPGLTIEDKQKLFGRFQKLSARPTNGETSTGLGLSIVKRFVDSMNGRIEADNNQQGRGAVFTVYLKKN